jgi:hypothetical protein
VGKEESPAHAGLSRSLSAPFNALTLAAMTVMVLVVAVVLVMLGLCGRGHPQQYDARKDCKHELLHR